MPFGIATPAVSTNQIFIYSSGIVSFGSELPLGATFGDASTLGHSFLAPAFADYGANAPSVFVTNVSQDYAGTIAKYRITWIVPDAAGNSVFQVELSDLSISKIGGGPPPLGYTIVRDPTRIGDIQALFGHSSAAPFWNGIPVSTDPGVPEGALIGWGVGALNSSTIVGSDPSFLKRASIGVNLTDAAAFVVPDTGVPEPSTWSILLMGFAGLGLALRGVRGRRRVLAS
ncbi:MAG: PEP-CTERM sorting domain-containing protein [Phenylobacterium sp.]